ncbi:chromosome segregation in meiosis-related protein [Marasmius tenuissimus]|uniref:Chromosome segregation in meiosis protein n=1 Tax=Marasmius tenuissimus TaxID=585030 RepID=A0ABR3ACU8_9AGAR
MDPLFLPNEEEEELEVEVIPRAPPPEDVDIDNIFADWDAMSDPTVNTGNDKTMERRAHEKAKERFAKSNANRPKAVRQPILPSSSPPRDLDDGAGTSGAAQKTGSKDKGGDKKEKKKPMRLDEGRLIGPTGFKDLLKETKHFQVKGKGHEATDLNRLLQVYQFWTHRMYPKSQFGDTVERIEKICHSRRMNVFLSTLRDEAHGKKPDAEASDEEEDDQATDRAANGEGEDGAVTDASERAQYASSSPPPANQPPSSPEPSGRSSIDDDDDFAAAFEKMDESNRQKGRVPVPTQTPAPSGNDRMDIDEEEDMWKAFDEPSLDPDPPKTSDFPDHDMDFEDEDLWDMVRENETAGGKNKGGGSSSTQHAAPVQPQPPPAEQGIATTTRRQSTVEEDWEDMYL